MTSPALFARDGDTFSANPEARSLWSEGQLHGGPVAGLLTWAALPLVGGPEWQVARITVDLFRPVPGAALRPEATLVRDGRRIRMVDSRLTSNGEEVVRAAVLALRIPDGIEGDEPGPALPPPERFPTAPPLAAGMPMAFHGAVEWRHIVPTGGDDHPASWIRVPLPLLEGEEMQPVIRAALTADFVNALGNIGSRGKQRTGYINTDISLHLHRYPEGEWIAVEVVGRDAGPGIATSAAVMHDRSGPFGRCTMATLANPRPTLLERDPRGA